MASVFSEAFKPPCSTLKFDRDKNEFFLNATIEQMFSKFGQICFSEKSFIHSLEWSYIEMISNLYFGWTYLLKLEGIIKSEEKEKICSEE